MAAPPKRAALILLATGESCELDYSAHCTVGRSRDASIPLRDPHCSRQQFEIRPIAEGWQLVPISEDIPTTLNGQIVSTPVLLSNNDRIVVGTTNLEFRVLESAPSNVEKRDIPRTLLASEGEVFDRKNDWGTSAIEIGTELLIGRDPSCNLLLDHPLVSRLHARITRRDDEVLVTDLVSANGTFVNGHAVTASRLAPGDRVDIGPYTLHFTGSHLAPSSRVSNIDLQAWRITRTVFERGTGRSLTLLDDISIRIQPGQFVCLLGPSGSGKSTLLSALSGRSAPDRGRILINSRDLYESFAVMKRDLAVVPQKDLLFDALTVSEALTYTARLRLPSDSTPVDVQREVNLLLRSVGLEARRNTPIRQLSGGQMKRVSLATELTGRPSLIFIDEVTSGLDEQTDREMMALFRQMAEGGKTVICITHNLTSVDQYCHGVVILAPGGVLAFVGTPGEATAHFGVQRLGDVYDALNQSTPAEWRQKFEKHPNATAHSGPPDSAVTTSKSVATIRTYTSETVRQFGIQARRRLKLLFRDAPALITLAVQTLVITISLGVVFGNLSRVENPVSQARNSVTLYFLLVVSGFWFGCNGSVKVLVADRPMYRRERAVNLIPLGYFVSTFAVYTFLSVLQIIVVASGVWCICSPPGMGWSVLGVLSFVTLGGTTLGLMVSAGSRSEEQAVAAVPLVLIPQLIFGGAIVALGGLAKWAAMAGITCYWGYRASLVILPADVAERANVDQTGSTVAIAMILLHFLTFSAMAYAILLYQDARSSRR